MTENHSCSLGLWPEPVTHEGRERPLIKARLPLDFDSQLGSSLAM